MLLSAASLLAVAQLGIAVDAQAFSAATVYNNTSSSVVLIFGFSDSGAGSSGTGSIMTRDGLVLTNNHVITNPDTGRRYSSLVVYFKPNPITGDNRKDLTTPFLVDVIARDPDLDLALLRVKDAPPNLLPMKIADSEEVAIGESVAAIGHPGGGGLWTLTTGTISSKRRDSERDVFQTDAAINPGNSGGPLLDEYSRLVGVNTFVRRVNDQGLPLEGLNYSLRSSLALAWINRQGVVHLSAISRGSEAVGDPTPSTTPPTTAPTASGSVNTPAPQSASVTPHGAEPTNAPTIGSAMEPVVRVEPEPESGARAFEGPNGAKMYGVPNPTIDLHDALIQARKEYQALTERADESVDEMNRRLDDYDNF
jgi:S1-C subfamily serine protease